VAGWRGCATQVWAAPCRCCTSVPLTTGLWNGWVRSPGCRARSCTKRFVQFLSLSPMQYLVQWRMQLATSRLRDSDAKVIEIALDVGSESEAAFSRAFKRIVGLTPGEWRRTRLAPPGGRPDPELRPVI